MIPAKPGGAAWSNILIVIYFQFIYKNLKLLASCLYISLMKLIKYFTFSCLFLLKAKYHYVTGITKKE